jgi:hypothetical protein
MLNLLTQLIVRTFRKIVGLAEDIKCKNLKE